MKKEMLHNALKSIRKFHRKTIQEAATEIGVSISYLSELENGHKRINQDILEGYSELFKLPISSIYLIAEQSDKSQQKKNNIFARKVSKIIQWISEGD